MGRGKKTQQLDRSYALPRNRGMPTDAPQRATIASSSGRMGHCHPPPVAYYYQPFSSTDILNWQRHTPTYPGEPQAMIMLMETIYQTHHPTWDDIIQLLVSLFSTEDRHRILTEARKWLREMVPEGTTNPQWWAELATPDKRPSWDCNREEGRGHLESYPGDYFTRSQEGGPKSYEYCKTLRSDSNRN